MMGGHGLDTGWYLLDGSTLWHGGMEPWHVHHSMRDGHDGRVDNGVHSSGRGYHWVLHGVL